MCKITHSANPTATAVGTGFGSDAWGQLSMTCRVRLALGLPMSWAGISFLVAAAIAVWRAKRPFRRTGRLGLSRRWQIAIGYVLDGTNHLFFWIFNILIAGVGRWSAPWVLSASNPGEVFLLGHARAFGSMPILDLLRPLILSFQLIRILPAFLFHSLDVFLINPP